MFSGDEPGGSPGSGSGASAGQPSSAGPPTSAATELERAERRLRQQTAVAALGRQALTDVEDLAGLAQAACEAAASILSADRVVLLERSSEGAVPVAGTGLATEPGGGELSLEEALFARVARGGEPLVIADLSADPDLPAGALPGALSPGSAAVVPLRGGSGVAGALVAASRRPLAHSDEDVAFLRSLANVVALAIQRARVQAQLHLSIDELRKSAEDRSRLLAHIVQAQEEERRRIADDIHDDSVQVMTAVALRLATLRRRHGTELDPLLLNLEHDVRQSITRLRHLMFVLRPPALEAHGIAAALHAFLTQITSDAGLEYTLDDRLPVEPEPEARTVVYRIAQEAVSNVCKHARAHRIDVVLGEAGGAVLVEIRDDGCGFDTSATQKVPPGRIGLLVMRERAELSGGSFAVESRPGAGTAVRYTIGSRVLRSYGHSSLEAGQEPGSTAAPEAQG